MLLNIISVTTADSIPAESTTTSGIPGGGFTNQSTATTGPQYSNTEIFNATGLTTDKFTEGTESITTSKMKYNATTQTSNFSSKMNGSTTTVIQTTELSNTSQVTTQSQSFNSYTTYAASNANASSISTQSTTILTQNSSLSLLNTGHTEILSSTNISFNPNTTHAASNANVSSVSTQSTTILTQNSSLSLLNTGSTESWSYTNISSNTTIADSTDFASQYNVTINDTNTEEFSTSDFELTSTSDYTHIKQSHSPISSENVDTFSVSLISGPVPSPTQMTTTPRIEIVTTSAVPLTTLTPQLCNCSGDAICNITSAISAVCVCQSGYSMTSSGTCVGKINTQFSASIFSN